MMPAITAARRTDPVATEGARLPGPHRAAILMLALGEQFGSAVWNALDDDEIRTLSETMANLGTIDSGVVEMLLVDFVGKMSATGAIMGNYESTEKLLSQFLPKDRVSAIMHEIRGPAGRNMWEKLSNVQEQVLANYLKNEHPQTVAVVLSKIRPQHAARVLAILSDDFALQVVNRMLAMEAVQKDVLERVEETLRNEFMSNLSQTSRRNANELMAQIFNAFDRQTEARFMTALEEQNKVAADQIRALMFVFEDLGKLDPASVQTLLRVVPRDKLAIALKGASQQLRTFFLGHMSARSGKLLTDDMEAMGPMRLKQVDEAQLVLVNIAKDLAAKGEIMMNKDRDDDELVY
jgi:flagellar motor switch protein FliG